VEMVSEKTKKPVDVQTGQNFFSALRQAVG
jgi:hypothetical protein